MTGATVNGRSRSGLRGAVVIEAFGNRREGARQRERLRRRAETNEAVAACFRSPAKRRQPHVGDTQDRASRSVNVLSNVVRQVRLQAARLTQVHLL